MPKVTVVVPVCNVERYLPDALGSVLRQTLSDMEIICVNDGSTDGSLSILKNFAARDGRIRIIDKVNAGYGAALNDAFDAAQGDYLTVLDADDILPQDACREMYEFCEAEQLDFMKADDELFIGDATRLDDPAHHVDEVIKASPVRACYTSVFNPSLDPGRYVGKAGLPVMIKTSFLRDHGIRLHESPGASFQDTGLYTLTLVAATRVRYLDKVTYYIRRDNPESSEKDTRKVYTLCDEYAWIHERVDEMQLDHVDRAQAGVSLLQFIGYEWNLTRIAPSCIQAFLERFAEDFRTLDAAGQLDRELFTPEELARLEDVMAKPEVVYWRDWAHREEIACRDRRIAELEGECRELRAKVDEVYASRSYRLGNALGLPVRAVRAIKQGRSA